MKEQEASAAITEVLTSKDLEELEEEEVEVLGYELPLPESDSDDDMKTPSLFLGLSLLVDTFHVC